MKSANFDLACEDLGLLVSVECGMNEEGSYPNQADLRIALDRLLCALQNWDNVDVIIRSKGET